MQRFEVINALIKRNNYKSYLEIGVQKFANWDEIICDKKVGVDPDPTVRTSFNLTSDDFFAMYKEKFDCIFIDGLHHADQVEKDIVNSLKFLNEGGTIVCHDMRPKSYEHQAVPRISKNWTGDCWKAWVKLRRERSDLSMFVVDTCTGMGVITRGSQETLKSIGELTYDNLVSNKREWLNLISVDEFMLEVAR